MKKLNDKILSVKDILLPINKIDYIRTDVYAIIEVQISEKEKINFLIKSKMDYDASLFEQDEERDYYNDKGRIWSYDLKSKLRGITHIDLQGKMKYTVELNISGKSIEEYYYEDFDIHYDSADEFLEECGGMVEKFRETKELYYANMIFSEINEKIYELKDN